MRLKLMTWRLVLFTGVVLFAGCIEAQSTDAGEGCQFHADCEGLCLEGVCVDVAEEEGGAPSEGASETEANASSNDDSESSDGEDPVGERSAASNRDTQSSGDSADNRDSERDDLADERDADRSSADGGASGTGGQGVASDELRGSNEPCVASAECASNICVVIQGGNRCAPASTACVPACADGQACVDIGGGNGACYSTPESGPFSGQNGQTGGVSGSGANDTADSVDGGDDTELDVYSDNAGSSSSSQPGVEACSALFECFGECSEGNTACQEACQQASTQEGLARAQAISGCVNDEGCVNLDGGVDGQCIEERCLTEYEACFGPLPTPTGMGSCGNFIQCLNACPTGDRDCQVGCITSTSPEAYAIYESVMMCLTEADCFAGGSASGECIEANCSMEWAACVGPAPEPMGTGTCEDFVACSQNCPRGNADCVTSCVESTSAEGYNEFTTLVECLETNGCNSDTGTDLMCLEASCSAEAAPCFSTPPGADVVIPPTENQCPETVSFVGQLTGSGSDVPNGGDATFEAWSAEYQAGIAEVLAAIPNSPVVDDPTTPLVDEGTQGLVLDTPLQITGATVIATEDSSNLAISRSRTSFWIGDADGAIKVYLNAQEPSGIPEFEIQTGQRVSFTVRRINRYLGSPEIIGIGMLNDETTKEESDMSLVSTGNRVFVWTPDREIRPSDWNRVVRITGNLTGTARECGGAYRCWDIDYGFGRASVRSNRDTLTTGNCITFVGPLNFYQGEPELFVRNASWLRRY